MEHHDEVKAIMEQDDLFEQMDERQQVLLHKFYYENKTLDAIAKDFEASKSEIISEFTEAVTKLVALEQRKKNPQPVKVEPPKVEAPLYDIVVKESELTLIKNQADKVVINAAAEIHLVQLIKLQNLLDEVMKHCKLKLAERLQEVDPDASSIMSDNLTIQYKAYGKKYDTINEEDYTEVPVDLLVATEQIKPEMTEQFVQYAKVYCDANGIDFKSLFETKYALDTKAIDSYMKKSATPPPGVKVMPRVKQLSVSLKKPKEVSDAQ